MASVKITLTRSLIGFEKSQRLTAQALGLGKVGSSVTQPDTPSVQGMIQKLSHVVTVHAEDGQVLSAPQPRTPRKRAHGPHQGGPGVKR